MVRFCQRGHGHKGTTHTNRERVVSERVRETTYMKNRKSVKRLYEKNRERNT